MLDEKGENFRYKFTVRDIRCRLGAGNRAVHRFAINPGEINSVYYHEGNARCYLLEASVIKGKGEFQVLGAVPELQKDYIKVAYECFKKTMNDPFSQKDVTVFLPSPIPDRAENNIGCAVFAALSSLVLNIDLAIQDIAFVGGVDLNGNLYFDEADVMPLMRAIENSGITTVYAPLGVGELLSAYMGKNIKTTVIEAQNVKNLMAVAMAKSRAS